MIAWRGPRAVAAHQQSLLVPVEPERIRKEPPVLTQRLAVTPVVVALDDRQQGAELGDRSPEPLVLGRQPLSPGARPAAARGASRTAPGPGSQVGRDGGGDPLHLRTKLLKRVRLEPHQAVGERLEPIDLGVQWVGSVPAGGSHLRPRRPGE